jgi:ABC-2 type transport system ATP-binding protein
MADTLSADKIFMSYGGQSVITDLSLDLHPGTFLGLIGPNGAGKSTLLLALSGQFKPDGGAIHFAGRDIYPDNIWYKNNTGYVHESPFLYSGLSIEDYLRFVAGVKGIPEAQIAAEISKRIEETCLASERLKLTSELSMGMRKKLAIAAAMLGSPKILFLDEALNGVDFESSFHIKKVLGDFVAAAGIVILSTHVLEVVAKLCNRYLIMSQGMLLADLDAHQMMQLRDGQEDFDLEKHIIGILRTGVG